MKHCHSISVTVWALSTVLLTQKHCHSISVTVWALSTVLLTQKHCRSISVTVWALSTVLLTQMYVLLNYLLVYWLSVIIWQFYWTTEVLVTELPLCLRCSEGLTLAITSVSGATATTMTTFRTTQRGSKTTHPVNNRWLSAVCYWCSACEMIHFNVVYELCSRVDTNTCCWVASF